MVDVFGEIENLGEQGVDLRKVVIQGSAPLSMLGIVEQEAVGDIDMVVSPSQYDHLKNTLGWRETRNRKTGDTRLQDRHKVFDAWGVWYDGAERRDYREMKARAHRLRRHGGLYVGCVVKDITAYKEDRMKKSDEEHLEAISDYLASHPAARLGIDCMVMRQVHALSQVKEAVTTVTDVLDPVRTLGAVATLLERAPESAE